MVLGSGIRDPGSGKNLFRIPDPGVKMAQDPGSPIPDPDPQHCFLTFFRFLGWVLPPWIRIHRPTRYKSNPDPKTILYCWFFFYSRRRRNWRICAEYRRWEASLLSLITAFRQSSRLGATPHGSNNRWRHPPLIRHRGRHSPGHWRHLAISIVAGAASWAHLHGRLLRPTLVPG